LPADIKPIREIAAEHDLVVVEDAAQAHGATCDGKPAGAFADAACWSLYASKNMTTGEGGVVTTNSDEMAETMRMIRTHGEKAKYASLMLGYNYRMTEIQAAIGSVQLEKLPAFLAKRRGNAARLTELLTKTKGCSRPMNRKGAGTAWYLLYC
jgi:perosamine synthetase